MVRQSKDAAIILDRQIAVQDAPAQEQWQTWGSWAILNHLGSLLVSWVILGSINVQQRLWRHLSEITFWHLAGHRLGRYVFVAWRDCTRVLSWLIWLVLRINARRCLVRRLLLRELTGLTPCCLGDIVDAYLDVVY